MREIRQNPNHIKRGTILPHKIKLMSIFFTSIDASPVLDHLKNYLKNVASQYPVKDLGVVFDIDYTLIADPYQDVVFPGMLELYKLVQKLGMKVFIVTARIDQPSHVKQTIEQLDRLGFTNYNGLDLMPISYLHDPNFSLYKYKARQDIMKQCSIVLNVGDTPHDLGLLPPYAPLSIINKLSPDLFYIFSAQDPSWISVKFPNG
jgi:hypothetical protein